MVYVGPCEVDKTEKIKPDAKSASLKETHPTGPETNRTVTVWITHSGSDRDENTIILHV